VKPKFQADACLNAQLLNAVKRLEPAVDIQPSAGYLPDGMADPNVLAFAASEGRILVTEDRSTMFLHFEACLKEHGSGPRHAYASP
jgi:hypothetical protein